MTESSFPLNNSQTNDNSKALLSLAGGHFCADTYSGFLNPIMPFIALNLHIGLVAATTVLSVASLCSSLIQPFFGFIADKLQKRFFIFWGLILGSVFLSLIGIAKNIPTLLICLVLGNIGIAFYHPQATGFVKIYSPKNPTFWMSIFLAAGTIGFSAGPLFSSYVTKIFGLQALPFLMLYGLLFAVMILLFVPKISTPYNFQLFKVTVSKSNFLNSFFLAIKESFSISNFRILFMIAVAKCFTVSSLCVFLPFLWETLNYDVSKIGTLLFLVVSSGALASISSSFFEKRFGALNVFYISLLSTLPLTLLFFFTYNDFPFVSYLAVILITYFAQLAIPINMVMSQNAVPEHKSLVSGFIGGVSWGMVSIFLPLTGFIAKNIGIPLLFLLLALIPTLTATQVKKLIN